MIMLEVDFDALKTLINILLVIGGMTLSALLCAVLTPNKDRRLDAAYLGAISGPIGVIIIASYRCIAPKEEKK